MSVVIDVISAAATSALRHAILRPNQPPETCVYPGDDDPGSLHFGVLLDEQNDSGIELIGVASFYREAMPRGLTVGAEPGVDNDEASELQLRIRGMAVLPEYRGRGHGRALVDGGLALARKQVPPPELVWCNARTTATGYYAKLGFVPRGHEFEIAGIGTHRVMVLDMR